MAILKLKRNDRKKELAFEMDFLLSLTVEERFQMMEDASNFLVEKLRAGKKKRSVEIAKRK